jgi:hypothetical protein
MSVIKMWLLAIIVLLSLLSLQAQNIPITSSGAQVSQTTTFNSARADANSFYIGNGVLYHSLRWVSVGTGAGCSIQVDSSANNITWVAGGVIPATSCVSSGNATMTAGPFNFGRLNVTNTGNGIINATYLGFVQNPPNEPTGLPGPVNVTQWGGALVALGQALMAGSIPVVISSNQSAIPVTGTFWPAMQPVSVFGMGPDQFGPTAGVHALGTDGAGNVSVLAIGQAMRLPLQPCNAVRISNCQHF